MSMLTPRGMGGQYKITGKLYPRMTRRRRKGPVVIGVVVALVVLATAGWGVYHFTGGNDGTAQACATPTAPAQQPVAATPAVREGLPDPSAVKVNVYNATDQQGLAKRISEELEARGFVIGEVANDPLDEPVTGPAVVRHGFPGTSAATVLGAQVTGSQAIDDARADESVDLVLGDGFQTLATPEAVAAALAPPPPPPPADDTEAC